MSERKITCISYGDRKYASAARFNLETAKLHGADRTILYTSKDIPLAYKLANWRLYYRIYIKKIRPWWRGAGYWVWKSYIVMKTLEELSEGDILIYSDGGSVYVNDIKPILECVDRDQLNIMAFSLLHIEKEYTKRDAFILLDADLPEYTDTLQHPSTYMLFRKSSEAVNFVRDWNKACRDPRIVSDSKNKMGKENYPEFVENRHDQTAFSLIAKKYHLKDYRDPNQYGNNPNDWSEDILKRSTYPQIWYSTRDKKMDSMEKFKAEVKNPFIAM